MKSAAATAFLTDRQSPSCCDSGHQHSHQLLR